MGYSWQKEAFDSLKELIARFGAKLDNWQIDYFACSHSSIKIDADACEYEEDELRAIIDGLGSLQPGNAQGIGRLRSNRILHGRSSHRRSSRRLLRWRSQRREAVTSRLR